MSHSVTITRTTATTSTSAFYVNSGYLQSIPGILKLLQLLLGAACVGIMGHYYGAYGGRSAELFYFMMTVTFLIGTFCLLASCIVSLSTATIISKTIYEVIYHLVACILYLAGALTLLTEINRYGSYRYNYEPYLAASIMGLIIAALYLFSTIFAVKSYRGI